MSDFTFGILGTGRIASKFCQAFSSDVTAGARVLAVASREISRARDCAKANNISRAYGSFQELLEDKEINAVYICTTNDLHFSCCKMAINAGKHILCEKPLTTCAVDARALADMAAEKGVFLMEAMWTRFLPAIRKAEDWVREGRIGELRGVKASLCARRGTVDYPRLFDPALGGGALLDLGVYCLHFARLFAGSRTLLKHNALSIPGTSGVDLTDLILLEYSCGFTADLSCSIDFSAPCEAFVFGERGYIRIPPWFNAAGEAELFAVPVHGLHGLKGQDNFSDPVFTEKFTAASGFEFQIAHTMDCIKQGKIQSDLVPLSVTIEAMELIDKTLTQRTAPGKAHNNAPSVP